MKRKKLKFGARGRYDVKLVAVVHGVITYTALYVTQENIYISTAVGYYVL